jgi:4,5-DOPA dioxygenase extradiol
LAPLRQRGVLVVGSGNVVHNLRAIDWHQPDAAFDWNRRFDDAAAEVMTSLPGAAAGLVDHPDYRLAAPTPDHFIPLLYVAGLAAAGGETAHVLVDGYAMGSLSMASYALGCDTFEPIDGAGAPVLPDVPADETNL